MKNIFPITAIFIALLCNANTLIAARADEAKTVTELVTSAQKKLRAAKTLNDYAAARKELLQAVTVDPKSALAQFWLGEATRWATRHAGTLPSPDIKADFDLALLDAEEAIRRYSLAINLDPKMARAYFGRGSFYSQNPTAARGNRDDFSKAIALDPKYGPAFLGRAIELRAVDKPVAEWFADFDKAIALGIPADGEDETYRKIIAPQLMAATHAGRGAAYLQQNQSDKALADFDKAVALFPDAFDARLHRANILAKQKQNDKALVDLNYALQKHADFMPALVARAAIYKSQNQLEKAKGDLRRALESSDRASAAAREMGFADLVDSREAQQRGDQWMAQNAFDEALAEYSRAIELDKDNVSALGARASVKMRRADLEGAQSDLDAALRLGPDSVKLLTLRGQVLARRGQFKEAMTDLKKATQLAPDDVAAWEQTGIVQQAQGEYSQAEKSYDKAIGFAAISALSSENQGAGFSLLHVRRLIVRAAQGKEDNWDKELPVTINAIAKAGLQICNIEIRKHPDNQSLKNLSKMLSQRALEF